MTYSPTPIAAAFRKLKKSNLATKLRAALVLGLIALISGLPFYAFAQEQSVPKVKKIRTYSVAPNAGSTLLYAGPNGETLCRDATPAEALAMRNAESNGLVQINHLPNEASKAGTLAPEGPNGLTIILRATPQLDANPTAKAAFIAAAAKWESLIKDPITVNVDVDFGTTFFGSPFTGDDVIGATESPQLYFPDNYADVRGRLISHALVGSAERTLNNALPVGTVPTDIGAVNTVFVVSPLLRALGGAPTVADDSESFPAPRIGFNSAFGFDFDPSDGITGNRTDFDAVAVHEMGHLLGFDSAVGGRELDPTEPLAVTIWDLFRFRPGTANLANFGTAQRILSSDGNHVQFAGGAELPLSTGKPDGTGGDLNQASHWKDDFLNGGQYIGIMDPRIPRNVRETMTENDQATIDSLGYLITPASPPPNDNFANAQVITGNSGSVNGTNDFATKETGEPTHSPDNVFSGKSIWYRWTAPNSGTVTMTTVGSTYDTLLAVYTGSAVNALNLPAVARNDDEDNPGGILTSKVVFSAVGGTTYQIAVDGYGGDQGAVTLNWTLPGGGTPTPTPTPNVNTVQFNASTASATETDGATAKAVLTVTRAGTTTAPATVNYATTDATASERTDYLAALGTLSFAANETAKTVTVFILNDSFGESPETFNITLSSPVGCTLGTPAAAVVTINSDEPTPGVNGSNPVKDASFNTDNFVRQQYVDFFNREADPGGLAFWKNEIDSCATQACRDLKRTNVSAAFFVSIEFQQTGYLVYKTNQSAYNSGEFLRLRDFLPDTQEIGRGVVIGQPGADAQLEANKVKFFLDFVQRPAFVAAGAFPTTMSATEFVDKLNGNTLDPRNPVSGGSLTATERTNLINTLNANPADASLRAQVLRTVAENSRFSTRQFNKAFVLMQYFGYLRRNPNDAPETGLDFAGYNFWLTKLNDFNGNYIEAEMVRAFITSLEYERRFGP